MTDTSYTVDTTDLPGGDECIFRIAASDGFHTAYDPSDKTFSVPRKAPSVFIMDPEEGQTYAVDDWVLLTALAYDQDDEDVAEENLAWISDLDGPLGTGFEVAMLSLSPGWHTIMLTGTDREGLTSSHSVRVYVGCTDIYLPLALRWNAPQPVTDRRQPAHILGHAQGGAEPGFRFGSSAQIAAVQRAGAFQRCLLPTPCSLQEASPDEQEQLVRLDDNVLPERRLDGRCRIVADPRLDQQMAALVCQGQNRRKLSGSE